jgi:hypothetical protein
MQPPLNRQLDESLGAVTERLLKAQREARPGTVRQFFALAERHCWCNRGVKSLTDREAGLLASLLVPCTIGIASTSVLEDLGRPRPPAALPVLSSVSLGKIVAR